MKAPFRKHTTAELADPVGSLALILGVDPELLRTVLLASGTEVRSLSFNGSSAPAWASMVPWATSPHLEALPALMRPMRWRERPGLKADGGSHNQKRRKQSKETCLGVGGGWQGGYQLAHLCAGGEGCSRRLCPGSIIWMWGVNQSNLTGSGSGLLGAL